MPETISFTEPLVATGEVRTEAGGAIANEAVHLAVDDRPIRVESDATGRFELVYRPTSIPLTTESVTVRHRPETHSAARGTDTTIPVSIEQVEPTLTDPEIDADAVAYGEPVTVRADLTANGTPVDDVPLVVSLDGQRLGQATLSTGTLEARVTIPAAVPAGERTLRVRLPFEERALAGVSAATTVTVVETEPELTLTADRTGERQLTVDGVLEANGDAVANESIQLRADGSPIATTTTDETGSFTTSVIVSASIADGTVPVTAVVDGAGSNLGATRAATTVEFPAGAETAVPSWAWIGLVAVAGGALASVAYLFRRSSSAPPPTRPAESAVPAAEPPPSTEPAPPPLLEPATDRLASGRPNAAVTACYAVLRERLAARIDASGALTHWEFQHRYLAQTDDDVDEALQTVTAGYERARFAPAGVSEREAEAVLEHAERVFETAAAGSMPAVAGD